MGILPIDLTGRTFGRLTVIKRSGSDHRGEAVWSCRCACGQDRNVRGSALRMGRQISCGCASTERVVAMGRASAKHGMEGTPEYRAWASMKARCTNPSTENFPLYGGRGITVCERWRDFENFYADMGPRPSPKHSLDRWPNNDGDYEPSNCRWATSKQQTTNRRSNRLLSVDGSTKTLTEWARQASIGATTVRERLKRGWPTRKAVFHPVDKKR